MDDRICAAAVAPGGDLIALLNVAGIVYFVPLRASGLFGATSTSPKNYGVSPAISQTPLEGLNLKLNQNRDSQMVSLRFNEAGDKLFAVDHHREIRIVYLQGSADMPKPQERKTFSLLSFSSRGKKKQDDSH